MRQWRFETKESNDFARASASSHVRDASSACFRVLPTSFSTTTTPAHSPAYASLSTIATDQRPLGICSLGRSFAHGMAALGCHAVTWPTGRVSHVDSVRHTLLTFYGEMTFLS